VAEVIHTRLAGDAGAATLLMVGPSLGTDVATLWGATALELGRGRGPDVEVVGWDLPGHGRSPAASGSFAVAELADDVRARAAELAAGRPTAYAGVSVGGAVGFLLATDPGPVGRVVAVASAPKLGEPAAWHERAGLVRRAGTSAVVEGSAQRWFAPGFLERDPGSGGDIGRALLRGLHGVDDASYAYACEALAGFDARPLLPQVVLPLLVVAGEHDPVVPPDVAAAAVSSIAGARLEVMAGVAHLPPAEDPGAVAALLTTHLFDESEEDADA
jgi:pimeloyl-ACP methyl ester carboxylesterase